MFIYNSECYLSFNYPGRKPGNPASKYILSPIVCSHIRGKNLLPVNSIADDISVEFLCWIVIRLSWVNTVIINLPLSYRNTTQWHASSSAVVRGRAHCCSLDRHTAISNVFSGSMRCLARFTLRRLLRTLTFVMHSLYYNDVDIFCTRILAIDG